MPNCKQSHSVNGSVCIGEDTDILGSIKIKNSNNQYTFRYYCIGTSVYVILSKCCIFYFIIF